ncbi:MAG: amidohydrolase family protein [Chloroflexi bacterium]|nr:amidohydrolase family protein [Chloroflexota bacterium]
MGLDGADDARALCLRRKGRARQYEFCNAGKGRLIGVGALDLRDVGMAAKEARRCVRELGFKSVYILPESPYEDRTLDHPHWDPLWAEVASLGVPLGTHEAMFHKNGNVGWVGAKQVAAMNIRYAPTAVTFGLGEMVGALMFTGAICARHPSLRVAFTESSVGWAATWFPFLDERWERAHVMAPGSVPSAKPSHYFQRQCYISGEPGEPGYWYGIEAGLENNLMIATDFPHPEVNEFPRVLDPLFDKRRGKLTDAHVRKILWDTPSRLFGLS